MADLHEPDKTIAVLRTALADLLNQARKCRPVDDHGHQFVMNMAYLEGERLLDTLERAEGAAHRAKMRAVLDLDVFSAATEMRRRGGVFVKCLAEAFFAADDENSATLVNAFAPLFKRYYEYAQQDSRAAG